MTKNMRKEDGFTLVELLIVVIILGILAAVAIPQFGSSTDDAKLSTLDSNLAQMRNAIELYHLEHNSEYPGEKSSADNSVAALGVCATSLPLQMTRYTTMTDHTVLTAHAAGVKGPYIKNDKMPNNPFTGTNTVVCVDTNDISDATVTAGGAAWKFYRVTGKFIANTAAHVTR